MSAIPFLTDLEIASLCDGLEQPAAQCRYLAETLSLAVHRKPNGRPLVARSEFERVIGAGRFGNAGGSPAEHDPHNAPNVVAMMEHLNQRKHGPKAQRR